MALATREHKRYSYSALLTAHLFLEALAKSNQPAFTEFVNSATTMSGRSASISVASDAMVCVECFRMKGDEDLKVPCQNPRCYFYLRVPCCDPQRDSMSPGPAFNKEVGCDRSAGGGGRVALKQRPSQSSDFLLSHCGGGSGDRSAQSKPAMNSIWAFKPENKAYMGKLTQHPSPNKMRSQSISVGSGIINSKAGLQCPSQRAHTTMHPTLSEAEKAKFMRSRMMSIPLVAGMESLMDGEGELVEDAFLSSPLPEFATTAERSLNPGAVGQKMVSFCTVILFL